ncbi:protein Wnt-1 isoform X2 [Zeugodacus cucurbitae]|nr:protein Wnt-1 isoform X2 [Zeugodacus cucurbitae]
MLLEPAIMCKKARRLRGKLAEICRHDSALLKEIIIGVNLGFRECEFQLRNHRWNCTTQRRSMRKILMRDTRETGFINAITSAGVTYSVTKACSMGKVIECACDKSHLLQMNGRQSVAMQIHQKPIVSGCNNNCRHQNSETRKRKMLRKITLPEGEWEWGGCSDNIHFGFAKSRQFLDSKYRHRRDLRTLVKLHNNAAGRLTLRESMRVECKCHGLSGSCTMRTCWLKMPPFREVAEKLRRTFDTAFKVILRNDGNSFIPDGNIKNHFTKYHLVYSDDSLNFCVPNATFGVVGTQERECNATSIGLDGCESLCCSRGYKRRIISDWVNCKCIFKWCCEVTCEKCLEQRISNTCL